MRSALRVMGETEEGRPRSAPPVARSLPTPQVPTVLSQTVCAGSSSVKSLSFRTNRSAGAMAAPVAEARSLSSAARMRLRSFKAEAAVPRPCWIWSLRVS